MPKQARAPHRVIGSGLVALDLLVETRGGSSWVRYRAGGTCANVLSVLGVLGVESIAVGRIGTGKAGDLLIRDLRRSFVTTTCILRDHTARTPRVAVLASSRRGGAQRYSFTCPACLRKLPRKVLPSEDQVDKSPRLEEGDFFFFDRASRTTVALANNAAAQGALVFFEPSTRPDTRAFREALAVANIIKYSRDRMPRGLEGSYPPTKLVIETRDGEGLRYRSPETAGRWISLPPYQQERVIDTAGAGDWCSAGIIASLIGSKGDSWLEGGRINRALAFGQALAAASIGHVGPRGYLADADRKAIESTALRTIATDSVPPSRRAKSKRAARAVRFTPRSEEPFCQCCLRSNGH
jgi:fructokinase